MTVDPFFIDWSGPDVEMAYASPVVVPEKGAKKKQAYSPYEQANTTPQALQG